MKAETLAELRSVMRGETVASQGVTVTRAVTLETPTVTPVTPVTPNFDKGGNANSQGEATADRTRPDDEAAIEERAALADGGVPAAYLNVWARFCHQLPPFAAPELWRRAVHDAGRFLDGFGSQAAQLGYTPAEIFDIHGGLVWRLAGARVEAIGADRVWLSDGRDFFRHELKGFR